VREFPEEAMQPGPAGTAPTRRTEFAPVWCQCGTRWQWVKGKALYVADDALTGEHPGHETGVDSPGTIPCSPVIAYDPNNPRGRRH
jgi:hypothetical protein